MEDSAIVTLYWQRSEQAIAESDTKYGPYCGHIAYGLLQNSEDTQECVSDTWLAAWNAMPPHRPAVLRLFLGKLTRRLSLQRLRRQGRLKRGGGEAALALEELGDCVPLGGDAQQALEGRELTRLLNHFLSGLPAAQRQVFLARYWYGAAVKAFTSAPTYVNRNPPMQMGIVAFQSTWPSLIYSQLHRLVVKMNVNRVVPIATWLLSPER